VTSCHDYPLSSSAPNSSSPQAKGDIDVVGEYEKRAGMSITCIPKETQSKPDGVLQASHWNGLDSRRCINFGTVEDCSQKDLRLGFFRNHEQSHGWVSLVPVQGHFTLWVLQLQHNVQARGSKRKKEKLSKVIIVQMSITWEACVLSRFSEMVRRRCAARFSFVPQQDGAFQWMAAAMVT